MAAKRAMGKGKQVVEKAKFPPYFKETILAGEASAAPPLGPKLGQPDRSITLDCYNPPATYFLKMAAGIKKGARKGDEIAGKVTLKHIYEIAKIKSEDETLHGIELLEICKMMIAIAHSCGIQVVRTLDPVEYREFLDKRKEVIAEQDAELEQIRQQKYLRL